MYELPSDMLSYVFVDQTIVYSVWSGLIIVPIWCAAWMVLFRLWQDEMWQEHEDWISTIQESGFECTVRSIWPCWTFSNNSARVALFGFPFSPRAYLWRKEGRIRLSIQTQELQATIDSLAQEGSISMPQNL